MAAIFSTLVLGMSFTVANPARGADSVRAASALTKSISDPRSLRQPEAEGEVLLAPGSQSALGSTGGTRLGRPDGMIPRPRQLSLNLPVVTAAGDQSGAGSVPDGAGGAVLAWQDYRNGGNEIYAQHVLATRVVDPTWPANGVVISSGAKSYFVIAIAHDGAGGAIVVWEDSTTKVHAQHVRNTGVVDPVWGPAGVTVATTATGVKVPAAISDGSGGAGGAFVTWRDSRNFAGGPDIFAMHLTSTGVDPAWPVNGLAVCTATGTQTAPVLCSDGATGAIIAWSDLRTPANSYDIYAQHVLVSGVVDPGWPADGAVVSARPSGQRLYFTAGAFYVTPNSADNQSDAIIPDGTGGCLVTWTDGNTSATQDVYVQHLLSSGVVDPLWTTGGVALCTAAGAQGLSYLLSDGAGGAIATWADGRNGVAADLSQEIDVQHVLNTGAVSGPPNGMAVLTGGTASFPIETTDGASGIFVFWDDRRDSAAAGYDIYAQHVLTAPSLAVDPTWPVGGSAVSSAPGDQIVAMPVWNDATGAVAAWRDSRDVATTGYDIYAELACDAAGTYYRDADGDGYGNPAVSLQACAGPPAGYVANHTDCDDGNPAVHPGATEICDGFDNNCNGQVDEIAHAAGLVGWWPGNGNANDATGNNNGTPGGTATYAPGKIGQAFSFDGAGYINNLGTTGSFSFLENTGIFTIEAWIKLNDPTALVQEAITAGTSTSNEKGHFFIWENGAGEQRLRLALMKAVVGVPIIESASPTHVITTNGWHHVAAVGDGTNITFYVDGLGYPGGGVMGAKPSGVSTRTLNIGRCPASSPECQFSGLIDEPAIYNRALTASEILAIAAAGSGGRCALVAVNDPSPSARRFEFAPPWPNPAERLTNLEFQLPASAVVRVEVVDVAGRRVSQLLEDGVLSAGAHRLRWDGRDASGQRVGPGVYLIRISTRAAAAVHRIVVIK